jgi:hypothetical protein
MRFRVSGVFSFLFATLAFSASGQKDYARKIVDTLASPYMAGRGYVDDGCKKAATYIESQFKEIGLLPFGKGYPQEFSIPVSTYPNTIKVWMDGKKLKQGIQYIVSPLTPTIKGKFPIVKFTLAIYKDSSRLRKFLQQDYSNTFIMVDDSGAVDKDKEAFESLRWNPFKAKGIIMLTDKLTEETADTLLNYALIFVNPWLVTDCGSSHQLQQRYGVFYRGPLSRAKKIKLDIENVFIKDYPTENLIGYVKGSVQPDSFVVFSAHYDHLGRMADIYFPGANDNASGTAMLLSLAKYYSQHQPKYSVAFISFGSEEVNIRGSHYYVDHPVFPLGKIKFLVNMDIMGTGDDGIKVVNGALPEYKSAFHDMVRINDSLHLIKAVESRGSAANSDHYFFYKSHVPDFFIYTLGGISAYHDIEDRRETLPLTKFDEVYQLLINFTDDICSHRF